jgi:SAM-dependent MidA family methyltransferase
MPSQPQVGWEHVDMVPWRTAMQQALYGPSGFYLRERPGAHFRTSVHASRLFASAVAELVRRVDEALGHPGRFDLVDVGAGGGELLTAVAGLEDLSGRLAPCAVEVAARPDGVPAEIGWRPEMPEAVTGLVIANEWLDNIPLDVVELSPDGPRLVLVDPATGTERLGPAPSAADLTWIRRWWPLRKPGDRAEVGLPRCAAWADVVSSLHAGLAVAIDYGHLLADRPMAGTLTGYLDGRMVRPVPDGSCDITAHAALDACLDPDGVLTDQRSALRALGLTGARPSIELARIDPRGYLAALCAAGEEAELIDPGGLGGFGWLLRPVGINHFHDTMAW